MSRLGTHSFVTKVSRVIKASMCLINSAPMPEGMSTQYTRTRRYVTLNSTIQRHA